MNRKQKIELLKKVAKGTPIKEALPLQDWTCYPHPHEAPESPTHIWNRLNVPFGMCVDSTTGETITSAEYDRREKAGLLTGDFWDFRNGTRFGHFN